ncbi:4-hydroxy-tetrahydrodipicolinate synthase [Candidatus Vidania fulgoroideorum]
MLIIMINKKIKGCIVSLITPMYKNGNVNFKDFKKLIKHLANNVDGFVVCGTTGESSSLTDCEKIKLLKIAKKTIPSNKHLIFGNCELNTNKALRLNKIVEKNVDAVLQTTPYYICKDNKNVLHHFDKISKASNIPIIIYNVPSRTGVDLNLKTILKLSKMKNVFAIKDSSGDINKFIDIKVNTNLNIYSGDDVTSSLLVCLGASGVISVTANLLPKFVRKMFLSKKTALKIYKKMFSINKSMFIETNPSPIKWILNKKKIISCSFVREPLISISSKNKRLILKIFNEFNENNKKDR